MSKLPGENLKNHFIFLVIALCKFGHRKHDISKTITARSFKLAQLIEDKRRLPGENLKKKSFYFLSYRPLQILS